MWPDNIVPFTMKLKPPEIDPLPLLGSDFVAGGIFATSNLQVTFSPFAVVVLAMRWKTVS
jgi:hypothetical protein